MTNLLSHFDRKSGHHAIPGKGRHEVYERPEAAAQALDRMEQAAEIQTLALSYAETEHHAAAEDALRHYAGASLADGDLYGVAKQMAPHVRWALLVELRAIGRAQTASDEAWQGMEQSGAEMLARRGWTR